jgi:hypothetical protein
MKQRSRYVTLALALVLLAGSAMPTRAQALLAATALTVGVAVAAISNGSVAAADDMAPDLSIAIKMDHANHTYRPGEQVIFEFVLQNHGATPTHPFVNILIPAKFTEVAIGNYVLDHCVVKPPTPSIPGHYINCEAPPEPQERLLNP